MPICTRTLLKQNVSYYSITLFLLVFSVEGYAVPGDTYDPEDYQAKSRPFILLVFIEHKMMSFFQQPRECCGAYIVFYDLLSYDWLLLICVVWKRSTITTHRMFFNVCLDSLFSSPS